MRKLFVITAVAALSACQSHKLSKCEGPLFAYNAGIWQPEAVDLVKPVSDNALDAELTGFTVEEGGVVKIHGTLPVIRLRDGDRVMCLYNRAYYPIGDNPGTGTTADDIERHIGEHSP